MSETPSIAIVGAGIIGLSCAWELSKRGANVTLYEKQWPPRGASWAAAGMLAPAYEAAAEEGVHPFLFDLCIESAQMWEAFAAELEAASGMDVGYDCGPTLALAYDKAGVAKHEAMLAALRSRGIGIRRSTPGVYTGRSALELESDGSVDNRAVLRALCAQVTQRADPAETVVAANYDHVLQTTGWMNDYCEPVRGQLLSLERPVRPITQVIRTGSFYIVPKPDRIVIGATSEPGETHEETDDAAIAALRAKAERLCPELEDCRELERWAGVRPVTKDHAPVLSGDQNGNWCAVGHARNGILLAPITAKIMADMILDNDTSDLAAAFSPARFSAATA